VDVYSETLDELVVRPHRGLVNQGRLIRVDKEEVQAEVDGLDLGVDLTADAHQSPGCAYFGVAIEDLLNSDVFGVDDGMLVNLYTKLGGQAEELEDALAVGDQQKLRETRLSPAVEIGVLEASGANELLQSLQSLLFIEQSHLFCKLASVTLKFA